MSSLISNSAVSFSWPWLKTIILVLPFLEPTLEIFFRPLLTSPKIRETYSQRQTSLPPLVELACKSVVGVQVYARSRQYAEAHTRYIGGSSTQTAANPVDSTAHEEEWSADSHGETTWLVHPTPHPTVLCECGRLLGPEMKRNILSRNLKLS